MVLPTPCEYRISRVVGARDPKRAATMIPPTATSSVERKTPPQTPDVAGKEITHLSFAGAVAYDRRSALVANSDKPAHQLGQRRRSRQEELSTVARKVGSSTVSTALWEHQTAWDATG